MADTPAAMAAVGLAIVAAHPLLVNFSSAAVQALPVPRCCYSAATPG